MGAVITKASSFGTVGTTFYTLLKYIKKNYGENLEICDVGCLDGIYTIPFLKKGYKVYAFEMNMIYLYGGHVQLPIINENNEIILQRRTIYGAEDRINIEQLHDKVKLCSENFFECNKKSYDVVYSKRVLHRKEYSKIPMSKKIKALQNAVKENGLIYLENLMWNDDENTENLNSNQYIKQCEMQKYFKDGWDILSIVEDRKGIDELPHIANPTFHKHRVGVIKARKNKQFKPDYFKVNMIF